MLRRDFLSWTRNGLLTAALASLWQRDGLLHAAPIPGEASDPPPHRTPKAKRVIHIYACGGVSHIDTFDYKAELLQQHGKSLNSSERPDVFFGKVGLLHRPFFDFQQRGHSGQWVSDLLPNLAEVADEMTFIKSMVAETSNHTPATFQANTGFRLNGFPVMGSWLSYGLGAETDELPAYVVLPDTRGLPAGGSINWSNGFLPARHQGVVMKSRGTAIDDLFPAQSVAPETELASRELLAALNRKHLEEHDRFDPLMARIQAYEMAAKMQTTVPEVSALESETEETQKLYGLDRPETAESGRGFLLARRLLERGVRFVQIFSGGAFGSPRINWDGHEDMTENHRTQAVRMDRPLAALIKDLRRRGMLDDTLVLFTTEFGRTPFTQSDAGVLGKGRDHSQYGFTVWMAGAGLKHGISYGATDEVGYRAVDKPTTWYDFHATVLHLLGINHERLTYYHNGIQRRLTNVHGHVIGDILS